MRFGKTITLQEHSFERRVLLIEEMIMQSIVLCK